MMFKHILPDAQVVPCIFQWTLGRWFHGETEDRPPQEFHGTWRQMVRVELAALPDDVQAIVRLNNWYARYRPPYAHIWVESRSVVFIDQPERA